MYYQFMFFTQFHSGYPHTRYRIAFRGTTKTAFGYSICMNSNGLGNLVPRQGAFPHLQSQFLFSLIERTKLIFPGSSVNDNNDVFFLVSFISIAILFLVIAFSPKLTYAKPVACKKDNKNKLVMSSAGDVQTSNIIFTVGATR